MSTIEHPLEDGSGLTAKGAVVAALTGLSRISGLLRDVVLSHYCGAGPLADAFFLAFRIPNFFRRLLAEGAFHQAFVPVLASYQETKTREELEKFVQFVAGNFITILVAICTLGVFLASPLVDLFTLGSWRGDSRAALASNLVAIMFPYLGLISLTAFAGAVLNSHQRFAIPAVSPVLLNVSMITAATLGFSYLTEGIVALAWGVLAAGVLQLMLHFPSLRKLHLLAWPRISWKDPGVQRMLKLIAPAIYAASAGQINILVGTIVASQLVIGTVSWLYYADRLIELPVGVVAIALQTVLLPRLSRLFQRDDETAFNQTLNWGMRIGILLALPATCALVVIAEPLISTIFLHGEFRTVDIQMTSIALQTFAIGVVPLVMTRVAAPGFFAQQDTQTPFRYATVGVVVNIVLSVALFHWLGLVGIAFATSVAATVNCYLLVRSLIYHEVFRPDRRLYRIVCIAIIASAVMVAVLMWINPVQNVWFEGTLLSRVGWLIALVISGLAAYLATLVILGVRPKHIMSEN